MPPRADPLAVFPWLPRLALAGLALTLAAPAPAEIYRWTDASGEVHFTQDLSQVPPAQRAAAREQAQQPASDRVQRYAGPASRARGRIGGPITIPFERRGTLMMVHVMLNDTLRAPFLVDTGASSVAIPAAVVQKLGVAIGPDTPRQLVHTANGVIAEPVVRIDSLQVGDARVEGVDAFVSGSMDVGLLGGAFFNNFVYRVDSAAGEITLEPNDRVRAGLTREQWGDRFRVLRGRLEQVDAYLEASAPAPHRRRLREHRGELAAALGDLERQANDAGVPQAWRE